MKYLTLITLILAGAAWSGTPTEAELQRLENHCERESRWTTLSKIHSCMGVDHEVRLDENEIQLRRLAIATGAYRFVTITDAAGFVLDGAELAGEVIHPTMELMRIAFELHEDGTVTPKPFGVYWALNCSNPAVFASKVYGDEQPGAPKAAHEVRADQPFRWSYIDDDGAWHEILYHAGQFTHEMDETELVEVAMGQDVPGDSLTISHIYPYGLSGACWEYEVWSNDPTTPGTGGKPFTIPWDDLRGIDTSLIWIDGGTVDTGLVLYPPFTAEVEYK